MISGNNALMYLLRSALSSSQFQTLDFSINKNIKQCSLCQTELYYNTRIMQGWFSMYSHRRKQLVHYQLAEGSVGADTNDQYLLYSKLLIKFWFVWKMVILLVDIYYINQCFLWLAFDTFYEYSLNQLLALNIVLLSILVAHLVFKVMMTPKLPSIVFEYMDKKTRILLYIEHVCRYDYNLLNLLIYLLFLVSYWVPYNTAQWLHLIYTFKLIELNSLMDVIYAKIYTSKSLRVLYRIIILTLLILYISHFIACVFYDLDQYLIRTQYFGDPVTNSQMYYQYSSTSFTPIQMLSQFQRYIMAFYFGNGLITTIAYGDIVGKNWIQDTYVGVMMIVSTLVVAFLLEEFLIMVEDNRFSLYQIVTNYGHLENMMTQKKVNENLKLKIRNYILYIQYYNKFRNPKNILSKLTSKMYIDLFEKGYGSYFQEVFAPLGFKNIRKMCQYMEEITYQPEIDIYYPEWKTKQHKAQRQIFETEALKPNLMFIVSGKVYQYVQWEPQSEEFELRRGTKYMNVFELITKRHVRYGVRTKNIVQLVLLKYEHFQEILEESEEFKKQMVIIKQMILSCSMPRKVLLDDCQACQDIDHNVLDCPDIHFVVDQYIERADKMDGVLSRQIHKRKKLKRKELKSTRIYNLLHYTVIFGNLSIGGPIRQQEDQEQKPSRQLQVGVSYLEKLITNLFEKAHLEQHGHEQQLVDTSYDPEGVDSYWAIEYNPDPLDEF